MGCNFLYAMSEEEGLKERIVAGLLLITVLFFGLAVLLIIYLVRSPGKGQYYLTGLLTLATVLYAAFVFVSVFQQKKAVEAQRESVGAVERSADIQLESSHKPTVFPHFAILKTYGHRVGRGFEL